MRNERAAMALPFWKQLLFSALIFISFFAIVEAILWLGGIQTRIYREDPFRGFSKLVPIFVREGEFYTTRAAIRRTAINPQSFAVEKPDNGVRIFGLGGSSAYGYPWGAEAAFLSIVGDVIAAAHPDREIETVNVAGMSYAMHRLRIVANELIEYDPDIFVIFGGHNEFIEAGFYDELKRSSPVLNRVEWTLSHTRIYSALHRLVNDLPATPKRLSQDFDAHVDRDNTGSYSKSKKEDVGKSFEENLRHIVQLAHSREVKVLLATVPCNLRDWRPNASIVEATLSPSQGRELAAVLFEGNKHLANQEYDAAIPPLEHALTLTPKHAATAYKLAQAYDGAEKWGLAREAYSDACDFDASPIRRLSEFNQIIRKIAAEEGALLTDIDHVFQQQSSHGLVGFQLIEDYVHPTQYGHRLIARHIWKTIDEAGWVGRSTKNASTIFNDVVAQRSFAAGSDTPTWLANQGRLLAHQGQTELAIDKFREAIRMRPDHSLAMYNLSVLLSRTGKAEEAEPILRRLLEIDDGNFEAYNALGTALRRMDRQEEAIPYFSKALEIKPRFALAWNNLANTYFDLRLYAQAIESYRQALEANPHHAGIRTNLGNVLFEAGWHEQAVNELRLAVDADPELYEAQLGLGEAYLAIGEIGLADRHLSYAIQLKPESARSHQALARALLKQGKVDASINRFEIANQLSPNDSDIIRELENARQRKSDPAFEPLDQPD